MSLATRVSLFFLGSLAVTLAGFSVGLYLLAARHLGERLERRVEAAVALLTAAIEIKPDCVEWEPHERRLDLEGVRWVVLDHEGRAIDSSDEPYPLAARNFPAEGVGRPARAAGTDGEPWLALHARVVPTDPARPLSPTAGPRKDGNRGGIYPSLVLRVSVPAGPDDASLRLLGWTLTGLSAAAWVVAALVGRRLCRRTLAPVARMARSARSIPAAEPGQRLKVAATGDELEDLGRSFNGLLDRLQEAFERQRRFTGEASHQLRTPLTAILGQVEVALRRERDSCEYRRVLTAVGGQAGRLHQIVELLLFLARADGEAAIPEACPTDLREWLPAHIDSTWGEHPRRRDLRVTVPSTDPVWVRVQPILLGQALDNLIDNALKHGPSDGAVEVGVSAAGGAASLRVADRGPGVPADEAAQVFQPFFRSVTARRSGVGGVGLGLAVAARIATAFRGQVALIPNADHGCIAEIVLPIVTQPHTI